MTRPQRIDTVGERVKIRILTDATIRSLGLQEVSILVTSAGRRVELTELLRNDAYALGLKPRILTTDTSPTWSAACLLSDKFYAVPRADSAEYAQSIENIILSENVRLLVPTIDTELIAIANHRDQWELHHRDLHMLSHSIAFVAMCRNKIATMHELSRIGIPTPKTYFSESDFTAKGAKWPLIAKPAGGSSSKGIRDVRNEAEFRAAVSDPSLLVQEKLEGKEYTVNVYVDLDGHVVSAIPHRREAIRGGEVEKGIVEELPGVAEIVDKIVRSFSGVRGPLNFQGMRSYDDVFFVFEINARFGGGFPLAHRAGGRFTRWALEEGVLRRRLTPEPVEYGWRMMRADRSFFVRG